MYNLSVVNIIPDAHRDAINTIFELYGYGPNNLSVKLLDSNNNVFWGCHSFWEPAEYEYFKSQESRAEIVPPELMPSLEFLYERTVLDGDAQQNWQAVLSELGLTIPIVEI